MSEREHSRHHPVPQGGPFSKKFLPTTKQCQQSKRHTMTSMVFHYTPTTTTQPTSCVGGANLPPHNQQPLLQPDCACHPTWVLHMEAEKCTFFPLQFGLFSPTVGDTRRLSATFAENLRSSPISRKWSLMSLHACARAGCVYATWPQP